MPPKYGRQGLDGLTQDRLSRRHDRPRDEMRRPAGPPCSSCTTPTAPGRRGRRGFTVVELIVCIGVVALLCGILLPSLRATREAAQRLACASNMRQIGVAIGTYAQAYDNRVPPSNFVLGETPRGQELMAARIPGGWSGTSGWDGLGLLVSGGFLRDCGCLYCASHHGEHGFERYANRYAERVLTSGAIYTNYHYSGHVQYQRSSDDPLRDVPVSLDGGRSMLLLTDGLRTRADFNHGTGLNRMFADLSVEWMYDERGQLLASLPETTMVADGEQASRYKEIWERAGWSPVP